MDFWLILYILLTVVFGGFSVSTLYKRGQNTGAILTVILLLLIFIFYGLRWFSGGELKGSQRNPGAWPPIVNMCPDFLVAWTDPSTKKVYCYDAANVYGAKQATSSGAGTVAGLTTGLTINGLSGQSAYLIKNPDLNPSAASLREDKGTNPRWPLLNTLGSSPQTITGDTTYGGRFLRWEGVMDGRQINPAAAPLP